MHSVEKYKEQFQIMFSKFGTQWMVSRISKRKVKLRKDLNADASFSRVRSGFETILDPRSGGIKIPLADALMSAFAMFSLKDPFLSAWEAAIRCAGTVHKRRAGTQSLKEAMSDKKVVFFVDAAHFVLAPFLGILWSFKRLFIFQKRHHQLPEPDRHHLQRRT